MTNEEIEKTKVLEYRLRVSKNQFKILAVYLSSAIKTISLLTGQNRDDIRSQIEANEEDRLIRTRLITPPRIDDTEPVYKKEKDTINSICHCIGSIVFGGCDGTVIEIPKQEGLSSLSKSLIKQYFKKYGYDLEFKNDRETKNVRIYVR